MDLVQVPHELLPEAPRQANGVRHDGQSRQNGLSNGKATTNGNKTNGVSNGNHAANGAPHASNDSLPVPRYEDLIGNTPLVDITSLASPKVSGVRVLAKCEFLNPGFSMKDRIVKNIFDKAEARGDLRPGGTVVAASSGNTGAAVAMLAAMRGYSAVVTTSPKCSQEKMDTIRAYGATLLVSKSGLSEDHPESYMNMAKTLAAENEGWFDVDQYENLSNPEGHYRTLGPEVWMQTAGRVTHFVAGGSTGGTISGTGRFLKAMNPDVKCVLADPYGSIFCDYVRARKMVSPKKFLVEGVGKGSIPGCLDASVVDEVIQVEDKEAFDTCHELARKEGLMVGGSAGLNTFAAIKIANEIEEPAVIVTVLCDLGIKYLTKVYNGDWLKENNIALNADNINAAEK